MVGNKCDMDEERVVPPEKGKHLADQLGETQLSFTSGGTDSRRNVSSSLAWDGWSERKTASGPQKEPKEKIIYMCLFSLLVKEKGMAHLFLQQLCAEAHETCIIYDVVKK